MSLIVSERRKARVDRRRALIAAAAERLLTLDEQAELAFLFWSGTPAAFAAKLSEAYATAKQYERFGGGALRDKLDEFQRVLNSNDFAVLYRAKALFCN